MRGAKIPCPKCGNITDRIRSMGDAQHRKCAGCGFRGNGIWRFEWNDIPKVPSLKAQAKASPDYQDYLKRFEPCAARANSGLLAKHHSKPLDFEHWQIPLLREQSEEWIEGWEADMRRMS